MSFCYHNFPEYRTWYIQPCLGSSLNPGPAPGCPNSSRVGTGAWYQRSWHQSYSEENKTSCPQVNPSNTHSSGKALGKAPRHSLATAFVHTFPPSLYFRKKKKNAPFTFYTDQTLWAVNRGENSRRKEKISSVSWRSSLTTRWQVSTRMWNSLAQVRTRVLRCWNKSTGVSGEFPKERSARLLVQPWSGEPGACRACWACSRAAKWQ